MKQPPYEPVEKIPSCRFQPFHGGQQTIASPLPIDSGPFVGQEFSTREAAFRNSEFFNKFL
jgi:hypothetical protein